jgi:hypothetical protein
MSDQPTPEVRALAAKLFAAGRAERPGHALGRRLLLIEPPQARARHEQVASSERRAVARLRSPGALWLAAAAMVAASAGVWLLLDEVRPINISPDHSRGNARSTAAERVAEVPAPLTGTATGAADVAPRENDAERVAPREAVARPRAMRPRSSADPALPPSAAPSASASAGASPPPKPMTLLAQLDILKRARTALRSGDGGQALELLERHARERAGHELDAEAVLLRIETLAALGRHGESSELAARFVRDNPNSALGDRAKSFIRPSARTP